MTDLSKAFRLGAIRSIQNRIEFYSRGSKKTVGEVCFSGNGWYRWRWRTRTVCFVKRKSAAVTIDLSPQLINTHSVDDELGLRNCVEMILDPIIILSLVA